MVLIIAEGEGGEIEQGGGISPKNRISSLQGSILVLGKNDSKDAWGRPVG